MKYKDGGNAAESTINCYGFFYVFQISPLQDHYFKLC